MLYLTNAPRKSRAAGLFTLRQKGLLLMQQSSFLIQPKIKKLAIDRSTRYYDGR
jgi:hypothetical protein